MNYRYNSATIRLFINSGRQSSKNAIRGKYRRQIGFVQSVAFYFENTFKKVRIESRGSYLLQLDLNQDHGNILILSFLLPHCVLLVLQ